MKKSPHYQQSSPSQGQATTEAPSKIARILEHLVTGGTLNRFDAEPLGDHCLNSTIAILANLHSLNFKRAPEKIPNRWGKPCRVVRYSLPEVEHSRALSILATLKRKTREE
ncbi:hypothetical protein [Stutzerimonas xanthomarina]|uniref:hypothetical protein n=1 Tax=Stutzerimonas xanthomarina TaxID=271420 RepID=UPI00190CB02F|nr:hypothetical protein [Stutzerimonas xanthomarina]MBK3848113.1 hypothetical protein [Stutzerimonas xanthomarina]